MSVSTWILLVTVSFVPAVLYVIWIRNTERCHRQNWWSIAACFLWGASIAVLAALILEVLFGIPLAVTIQNENKLYFFSVVVLAPIIEEFTKPLALRLRSVKKGITELEDGFVYGAVAGLGFSATENLFYGLDFLAEGLLLFLVFMIVRSIGGCLLHASATALTGYGYGKTLLKRTSILHIFPYFLLAIGAHSFYNFLVTYQITGAATGLFLALFFVIFSITLIRKKIKTLDRQNC